MCIYIYIYTRYIYITCTNIYIYIYVYTGSSPADSACSIGEYSGAAAPVASRVACVRAGSSAAGFTWFFCKIVM